MLPKLLPICYSFVTCMLPKVTNVTSWLLICYVKCRWLPNCNLLLPTCFLMLPTCYLVLLTSP